MISLNEHLMETMITRIDNFNGNVSTAISWTALDILFEDGMGVINSW